MITKLIKFADVTTSFNSSDYKDKVALIKAGYAFEEFVTDTDWQVRAAMADEVPDLVDLTLYKDTDANVRHEVAKNTIKVDILRALLDDENTKVSKMAAYRLMQDEDYRQEVLDKFSDDCVMDLSKDNYDDSGATPPVVTPPSADSGYTGPTTGTSGA